MTVHPQYLLPLVLAAAPAVAAEPTWPRFTDVTEQAGIRFKHSLGDRELSNIVEGTGPGGMFLDYDNDGLHDLYFVNGCWHKNVSDNKGRDLRGRLANALYRNAGDGTFVDVTEKAGAGDRGFGMGASCADYDNDGDGTFTDVTQQAGLSDPSWSVAAVWLDHDRDGDLDVYVCNYLEYDKGAFQRSGAYYKAQNYPGPLSYSGRQDHLFRNNGDGTFTDVTGQAGLEAPNGRSMSGVAVDIDSDGDTDVFVTNDAMPNHLWINDGKGRFEEKALEHGLAFGEGGQGASSMGPVVGDIDRNGLLDLLIPDMGYGCLMWQKTRGLFDDGTAPSGLARICGQYTGWGGGLVDFDNDGYLDVFIANGNAHHLYTEEAVLARYDGDRKFKDVAGRSGEYFSRKYVGRGAAFGDYNNDGNMDVLVFNLNDRPCLLRNEGGKGGHWLKVVPRSRAGGAIAIGATVTVHAGSLKMVCPIIAVNGYLASNDPRAHFGLGAAAKADLVEIRWPDGTKQQLEDVPADRILEVTRPEN